MMIWDKIFQIYRPLPSFPMPRHIAEEEQYDSSYHCESRLRHGNSLLFVCSLKGRGQFRTDGVEYDLPEGTAFLCRDRDHDIAWYYPDGTTIPWRFFWFNFQGAGADAMITDLLKRHGHIYRIDLEQPILKKLYGYRQRPEKVCDLTPGQGAELIFRLLDYLAGIACSEQLVASQNILVKNAQTVMLQQLESRLTIADFAEQLAVSREHFTRVFKYQTGIAPAEYLLRYKMLRACELLKDSHLNCQEIAMKLGYNSATNFSRAFRKLQNSTPQQFRQNGSMPIY